MAFQGDEWIVLSNTVLCVFYEEAHIDYRQTIRETHPSD